MTETQPLISESFKEDTPIDATSSVTPVVAAAEKPNSYTFLEVFRNLPEERRKKDSSRIIRKHPGRVPVIVIPSNQKVPPISNHKYIVPTDMPLGQFITVIRSKMTLSPKEALYLFVSDNKVLCSVNELMSNIYSQHMYADGYLYIYYQMENTFG